MGEKTRVGGAGEPTCVIGTNSWGTRAYERAIRGSYVDESTISQAVDAALARGIDVFDTAEDYGFGYAQRLLGMMGATRDFSVSAKYTPTGRYKPGRVREAFERDCRDLGTSHIDHYWLHLPNDTQENLEEIAALYDEGRIGHVGISNFDLGEARQAKAFLEGLGVPLYGVQNHFSLLDRGEETSGMLAWCHENGISFWGWAVLEEGILSGAPAGPVNLLFGRWIKRLQLLFRAMEEVGEAHGLSVAQVAVAYCASKGVVPICGCRKPYQVEQLAQAAATVLDASEIGRLEHEADLSGARILRSDMFRFAVHGKDDEVERRLTAVVAGSSAALIGLGIACLAISRRDSAQG